MNKQDSYIIIQIKSKALFELLIFCETQNIQIPRQNQIPFIILIKHTCSVCQVKIDGIY